MSFLIAIVLPFAYMVIALLVTVPAWKRAVTAGGSYKTAWVLTLVMGMPFILLGINRTLVWQVDREVDRLCALDGGVRVYETVTLGPENFGPDGTVFPQYERLMAEKNDISLRYGPDYVTQTNTETLRQGRALFVPRLTRSVGRYLRVSDGKRLAEWIRYHRYGGDLPGPWVASSHGCPASMYRPPIDTLVFVNSGRTK
jgi:hypothetical protein